MSEPLDLRAVEARLRDIGAPYSGAVKGQEWQDIEALLAALRETRAALRPFVEHPGHIPQSMITRAAAVLATCVDGGHPSEGPK